MSSKTRQSKNSRQEDSEFLDVMSGDERKVEGERNQDTVSNIGVSESNERETTDVTASSVEAVSPSHDCAVQVDSSANAGTAVVALGMDIRAVQSIKPVSTSASLRTDLSTLGIRFSKMDDVYSMLGGRDFLEGKTTSELRPIVESKTTEKKLSLCCQLQSFYVSDSANGIVAEANWFISHAWSYKFLDVMEAVEIFMLKEYGVGKMVEVVIWFDLFSNSQHNTEGRQIPFEWLSETFMSAVRKINNVLMILEPWDNPVTLTRAWCVFEVLVSVLTKSRFEVTMSKSEAARFLCMIREQGAMRSFHKMLSQINSSKSTAFYSADVIQVHGAVQQLSKGFVELDSTLLRIMETWMLSQLESQVDSQQNEVQALVLQFAIGELLEQQGKYDAAEPLYE
jgi:hypothetical protein